MDLSEAAFQWVLEVAAPLGLISFLFPSSMVALSRPLWMPLSEYARLPCRLTHRYRFFLIRELIIYARVLEHRTTLTFNHLSSNIFMTDIKYRNAFPGQNSINT